ncbi:MAG TPA: Pvc16 family protein [Candidatus Acidoferrum sp.]|nr:Pvc16 family protein [Candidatus Acidoferrum sp.]
MVQKDFITVADRALANYIWNKIKTASTTKNIILSQEQISFSSPKDNQETRKISIFLYKIVEETAGISISPSANDPESTNQPYFVLSYLVTPFTGNDKDNHTLIEKIICLVLTTPQLDTADDVSNLQFKVKIDSLSLDELTKLWIALGVPLRLSLSLTISTFEPLYDSLRQGINDNLAIQTSTIETRNVTQSYQVVLKTFTEQSTGWMNRNMLIKQWVLQEFKKNTGMTVEEMLSNLNHLGDKLAQHQPTIQFKKTLNLLAGYYQHQLDELKGMPKLSQKQTKNIETVTTWINDINALVEVLTS